MPKTIEATRERVSHHVSLERLGFKEEIHVYYRTNWRGTPARVTMCADRYTHSSGVSDWRVWAVEAREIPEDDERRYGNPLTDTARSRLGDAVRDDVRAWLASDEYRPSEQRAYFRAVRDMTRDLSTYGERPADRMRTATLLHAEKLTDAARARLGEIADAYDRYAALVRADLDDEVTS